MIGELHLLLVSKVLLQESAPPPPSVHVCLGDKDVISKEKIAGEYS